MNIAPTFDSANCDALRVGTLGAHLGATADGYHLCQLENGQVWWYILASQYRGLIPEARTKYEAEQAELASACVLG